MMDLICLIQSRQDFSVMNSAFKDNARANVAKYVFDAFEKDFMIGAYFSKPDCLQ